MKPLNYTDELIFIAFIVFAIAIFLLVCNLVIERRLNQVLKDYVSELKRGLLLRDEQVSRLKTLIAEQEKLLLDVKINNCEVVGCVFESNKPL